MVPYAVYLCNKHMGCVDELDRLRMCMHGFEGIGRAHRWTSRVFDCCVNILMQTAYKIYEHCRDNKLGNEEPMSHAEFNESVIRHLPYNSDWRHEQLSRSKGRRASVRSHAEFSSLSSNSSLEATRNHTMGRNDEKCSQKSKKNKTISYACRVCRSGGGSGNLTSRTIWYCKECSKACKSDENRVYLHSQCFGRWHDIVDARNNRS